MRWLCRVAVVMGVSGSGKSTVAALLAARLGWDLAEGDDFHPPANIAKMADGVPLSDADREPWLLRIAAWIDECRETGRSGVIACSALRRRYRDVLRRPEVVFVHLTADKTTIERRLLARRDHFMPTSLLDSQLAILEPPAADETAIGVNADGRPLRWSTNFYGDVDGWSPPARRSPFKGAPEPGHPRTARQDVAAVYSLLQHVADARQAAAGQARQAYLGPDDTDHLTREELLERVRAGRGNQMRRTYAWFLFAHLVPPRCRTPPRSEYPVSPEPSGSAPSRSTCMPPGLAGHAPSAHHGNPGAL